MLHIVLELMIDAEHFSLHSETPFGVCVHYAIVCSAVPGVLRQDQHHQYNYLIDLLGMQITHHEHFSWCIINYVINLIYQRINKGGYKVLVAFLVVCPFRQDGSFKSCAILENIILLLMHKVCS